MSSKILHNVNLYNDRLDRAEKFNWNFQLEMLVELSKERIRDTLGHYTDEEVEAILLNNKEDIFSLIEKWERIEI